jgi:eukaryotic-like serine/threonine-protein kinase
MSTLVGMLLDGRYRLDELIGTGGMSTVYRAWDQTLEREVAIKLMHREVAADSDQLERFRREARAVAQLSHPHVVTVIDAGEDNQRPYIVFEYVQGETLKDRIRRCGRLEISEAVAYAIEIARALGAAHAAHMVHRDVKPQNVLIDAEGSAKVTDFGIARTLDEEGLTAEGRVLGTTDYVSPEQALGHGVTGQSDLYSLGIVLFEMLTGDVPFRGENQVAVAMKHVREQVPDVQWRRPEVSAALAAVVDRATDKDLTRRYGTADEMIWDLEDALAVEAARSGQATGEATSVLRALPEERKRRLPARMRRPVWLFGALLAVAGAVAAIALIGLSDRTERGTGQPVGAERPTPGLQAISLGQAAAGDYDPIGGDGEHPEETTFVVDRDRSTTWSTETYRGPLNKDGVGVYVDAEPGVAASALDVWTDTNGWRGTVYGATGDEPPESIDGWTRLAGPDVIDEERHRFRFDTKGKRYRYYLVWITDLGDNDQVEVSEVTLYESKASPTSLSSNLG